MKSKCLLSCLAAVLLSAPIASAQTILAKWTFETSQPGVVTLPAVPGAGNWLTNIVAENGSGTASGWHSGFGNPTYSSPTGNGSSHSFSCNGWTNNPGDFAQFAVSTVGFQNVLVTFDQYGSSTGPGKFYLAYSTDGVNFTQYGSIYTVLGSPTWSASTSTTATSYSFDLSSITALNNASVVYIRLVDANNTSVGGATVGTGGTDRVDNFAVTASTIPGFPTIITQPQSGSVYWGDAITLNVVASGTAPSIQWYYPNLNSPLTDGSSGHGVGTISGSISNALTLSYVDPSQAGNYQVIITNSMGSVTSQVAHVTVNTRTPIVTNIAYLRTLHTANWLPSDTTNLYTVTGIVTTFVDMTSSYNSEFFLQDGTAGIAVYAAYGGSIQPSAGDKVQVTGPLSQFDGLLELSPNLNDPAHSVTKLTSGNPLPTPIPFALSQLTNIPATEALEGSRIVVCNVVLQAGQVAGWVLNNNTTVTNLDGQTLSLFVNANIPNIQAEPVPEFASSIVGVLSQYTTSATPTNGYEIDITQYPADVTACAPVVPMRIGCYDTNAVVCWSAVPSGFTLQTTTNLAANNWQTVAQVPATANFQNTVTNARTGGAQFFRLVRP